MRYKYTIMIFLGIVNMMAFSQNEVKKQLFSDTLSYVAPINVNDYLRTHCDSIVEDMVLCPDNSVNKHLNWIFFIDGKLPNFHDLEGYFSCGEDSLIDGKIVKFQYITGDLNIPKEDFKYIINNKKEKIRIVLRNKEYDLYSRDDILYRTNEKLFIYTFEIDANLFLQSSVVFNIFNINRKKGVFGVTYTSPQYWTNYRDIDIKDPSIFSSHKLKKYSKSQYPDIITREMREIRKTDSGKSVRKRWNRKMKIKSIIGNDNWCDKKILSL